MLTIGLLFWLLYIIGFLFGIYREREALLGTPLFWWVLILLLGIGTFGWPIKG